MRRSRIHQAWRDATAAFTQHGWALPPNARWDITDFGLGRFETCGLTLINLAEEAEYCEKLMYAHAGQVTPMHTHRRKKEDIICRWGVLELELLAGRPGSPEAGQALTVRVCGEARTLKAGERLVLQAGERVTLTPGIWHAFAPRSAYCVIGEVSTANDDVGDNCFADPEIGRFPGIEEDEPRRLRLVSEP